MKKYRLGILVVTMFVLSTLPVYGSTGYIKGIKVDLLSREYFEPMYPVGILA